jgi:hypothetical protein
VVPTSWVRAALQVDKPGSRMHEAFIYNAAQGRLDVYAFDMWNMHQCQCGRVQTNMRYCTEGYVSQQNHQQERRGHYISLLCLMGMMVGLSSAIKTPEIGSLWEWLTNALDRHVRDVGNLTPSLQILSVVYQRFFLPPQRHH